ncbi:hypothetical protein Geu3261_0240_010 [Komagataeibacter europaeus NBRC 3261]|uniref:Uncharacterized protein n=1 Tax=Komagataeibacter europaeus NBRC 3261 TaxID=1234669 RepID=A0A0D6Q450_KOMEU|nr:hypothetical protein [Komagataeibacter europaeus]GAN97735.1 hypothetical protein Geu3261_0240_010 [Komagataeibacter europaeus NBRC 3261]
MTDDVFKQAGRYAIEFMAEQAGLTPQEMAKAIENDFKAEGTSSYKRFVDLMTTAQERFNSK